MDRSPETPGLDCYYACTGCDEELHLGFDGNWTDSLGFLVCRQKGNAFTSHHPKIVQREFTQAVIF